MQHHVTIPASAWTWFDLVPVAPASQSTCPKRLSFSESLVPHGPTWNKGEVKIKHKYQ